MRLNEAFNSTSRLEVNSKCGKAAWLESILEGFNSEINSYFIFM
jgi:hypothetical protein